MVFLRSCIFNVFMPVWTVLVAVVGSPLMLAPHKITARVGYVWACGVIAALRVICGITYEIRGQEHLPQEACLIAAKHQSAWDTVIFLKVLNLPVYILKKELKKIPFFGWYLPRMGMIAIDRNGGASALKDMVKQSRQRLSENRSIVIFPEGTRTFPGDTPKEYQSGVAALYTSCHVPVVPVALNSGVFWSKSAFMKKPGKITLEYLPVIPAGTMKRHAFMTHLEAEIETASGKLLQETSQK